MAPHTHSSSYVQQQRHVQQERVQQEREQGHQHQRQAGLHPFYRVSPLSPCVRVGRSVPASYPSYSSYFSHSRPVATAPYQYTAFPSPSSSSQSSSSQSSSTQSFPSQSFSSHTTTTTTTTLSSSSSTRTAEAAATAVVAPSHSPTTPTTTPDLATGASDADVLDETYNSLYFLGLQQADPEARKAALDAVIEELRASAEAATEQATKAAAGDAGDSGGRGGGSGGGGGGRSGKVQRSRSSFTGTDPLLATAHVRRIVRFARECPYADVRQGFADLVDYLENDLKWTLPKDVRVSYFYPANQFEMNTVDTSLEAIYQKIYVSHGRVSHFERTLGWHPTYLTAHYEVYNLIMKQPGPLPLDWRCYLGIMAASVFDCQYLIDILAEEFITAGGDPTWLETIENASAKLIGISKMNTILGVRPWAMSKDVVADLIDCEWSMSEIVHAIVILCTFHGMARFSYGTGLHTEIDYVDICRQVSSKDANESETEQQEERAEARENTQKAAALMAAPMTEARTQEEQIHLFAEAASENDLGDDAGFTAFSSVSRMSTSVGSAPSPASMAPLSAAPPPVSTTTADSGDADVIATTTTTTTAATGDGGDANADAEDNNTEAAASAAVAMNGKSDSHHSLDLEAVEPAAAVSASAPARSGVSALSASLDARARREREIAEQSRSSGGDGGGGVSAGSSSEQEGGAGGSGSGKGGEGDQTAADVSSDTPISGDYVLTPLGALSRGPASRFSDGFTLAYADFRVKSSSKAKKKKASKSGEGGNLTHESGFDFFYSSDYSWADHGYSLVAQFYAEAAPLLDKLADVAYNLTDGQIYDMVCDTKPFRRSIWFYAQRVVGVFHSDYDYGEPNRLLNVEIKKFIKKAMVAPATLTKHDFDNMGYMWRPEEKCHILFISLESLKQATLLYGLHAVMKHMMPADSDYDDESEGEGEDSDEDAEGRGAGARGGGGGGGGAAGEVPEAGRADSVFMHV